MPIVRESFRTQELTVTWKVSYYTEGQLLHRSHYYSDSQFLHGVHDGTKRLLLHKETTESFITGGVYYTESFVNQGNYY